MAINQFNSPNRSLNDFFLTMGSFVIREKNLSLDFAPGRLHH